MQKADYLFNGLVCMQLINVLIFYFFSYREVNISTTDFSLLSLLSLWRFAMELYCSDVF